MAPSDPYDGFCDEVLAEVWMLLDHEVSDERDAQLRRHLEECGPCLAQYGIEQKLKAMLARSCREQAPDDLHQRLRERIRGAVLEQAEVTVERGPAGTVVEVNHTRVESWRT